MPIESNNSTMPDLSSLRIDDHKRRGSSVGKWLAMLLVIGAVVAAAAYWGKDVIKARGPEVEVAAAVSQGSAPAPALLNATGYVTPRRRATVAAKITGKIKEVFVDEGVHVTEGQGPRRDGRVGCGSRSATRQRRAGAGAHEAASNGGGNDDPGA
jgi:hypothetical protein